MPYLQILLMVVAVAFFFHGAKAEEMSPLPWVVLSLLAWYVACILLGGGPLSFLLGQGVVYGLMFAWKLWRERRRADRRP